uniref:Uncharacterized protein n=1 Tax=Cacopsylla melanoneura TaxID=428564 RepID=A0A8D8ZLV7_9HEMI
MQRTSRTRPTSALIPGLSKSMKCIYGTDSIRNCIRTEEDKWLRGNTVSASSATVACRRATSRVPPTPASILATCTVPIGSTRDSPSLRCTLRTKSLILMDRDVRIL